MSGLLISLYISLGLVTAAALFAALLHWHLCYRYMHFIVRIFQEKPLFIVPRGQPVADAEDVAFHTRDGLTLHGCYLHARGPRRGVVLFGLEFGSNCWSCVPYCEDLLANGFDVFSFESRNQGESESLPGYDPLQWVTDYEVWDTQAALAYLKQRDDAEPRGVGFFGISKGGGAGLLAAADDPYVRCCITDGAFATFTTMIPYMRKWVTIYSDRYWLQVLLPTWFYALIARTALRRTSRERGCRFPPLERALPRLAPRPWLMIHGGADSYIKPEMAQALFRRAGEPKASWIVEDAKHNQSLFVAGDAYAERVRQFFIQHLALPAVARRTVPEVRHHSAASRRANAVPSPVVLKSARPGS